MDLFQAACDHDLGGTVVKCRHGRYAADATSIRWLKIKNEVYSPMEGLRELFQPTRSSHGSRRSSVQEAAPRRAQRLRWARHQDQGNRIRYVPMTSRLHEALRAHRHIPGPRVLTDAAAAG